MLGCTNEAVPSIQEPQPTPSTYRQMAPGSRQVFVVQWTDWGRLKNQECVGWGLCNFESCWFCCIDDVTDELVDCQTGKALVGKYGVAQIDDETGEGYMVIRLDPSVPAQADAIANTQILYVDEVIVGEDFQILAGEYAFDPTIGLHGGYLLDVAAL